MQFPDRRGDAYEKTIEGLNELKAKVAKQLKTALAFLNEVAAKHVPKSFQKYIEAIRQEVEEHVMFEDHNLFLYVSTSPEKQIVFTYYLMLLNATNDEGKITPSLYISVQWVLSEGVTIQINPEYELPGQLLKEGGNEVSSVPEAVKAIGDLLALEDFSSALGTVPLSTMLRKPLSEMKPEMFSYRDFIQKLDVDEGKLVFKFRPDISKDDIKGVTEALFAEVHSLFKNPRKAKLKMAVTPTQVTFTVTNLASNDEVSTHDAEFLFDKFDLENSTMRKVINLLNNSKKREKKVEEKKKSGSGWEFTPGDRGTDNTDMEKKPAGKEKLWL
jgi:hypothetical protein